MTLQSFVKVDLMCTGCGAPLAGSDGLVSVAWGYLRGSLPKPVTTYAMGDAVRWRTCRGGAEAWTRFADATTSLTLVNFGDPAIVDLVLLGPIDRLDHGSVACDACRATYGGVAIEINGGVFTSARVAEVGEFGTDDVFHFTIDGMSLIPQPTWLVHTYDQLDCGLDEKIAPAGWRGDG